LLLDLKMRQPDMLVLASELYAPVFNRYFRRSLEQVDFPNNGRAQRVGFANLYDRAADPLPLDSLRTRVAGARRDGRRLWLVSSIRVTKPDSAEVALAIRQRNARVLWRMRIAQVKEIVAEEYGPRDSVFAPAGTTARYDRLELELYAPEGR
jgi:hypothetical protein